MMPIKIQCGCGQRYAFEVEAADGRMPYAVACPVCGVDGTPAADAVIAQSVPVQAAVAVAPAPRVHLHVAAAEPVAVATPPPRGPAMRPGQMDREQAVHEARAKISWGDTQEEVIKFLMIQGFTYEEATGLASEMFQERAKVIRGNGIRKIFIGAGLICVPIVAVFIFLSVGFFPLKIFGLTVAVGLYGAWTALKGTIMFVAPKSEPGDVAEQ